MAHCTHGCVMNVINLGNSIIGVSILAMPYCFRKCGILLSILLIIASGILVRSACYLLLKAAIKARRRNFEFLAFHTLGSSGKLFVEIGIIGFLIGVCIALFVVIGDLGPPLASEYFMVENTSNLRAKILVCLGLFVALPLGLLRKVDSLTSLSALSIGFYGFLVLKIISEAVPKLTLNEWWYEVNWWQPSGILPCLPIFSMALSCQTQLFEFFDTLNDPSLKRMTSIVGGAVNLCSSVYILVGLFGYIAFCDKAITGNVLLWLTPSLMTEIIKCGFIVTVVISFPLCLFPCRTSLHSLLFKQGVSHHDLSVNFIPDQRFKGLTVSLVTVTVGVSIMLPNIEIVLGFIGSTIGTIICLILPAMLFIRDINKDSSEKRLAQVVLFVGIFILVACTYYTLRQDNKPHVHLTEEHNAGESKTEKIISSLGPVLSQIPPLLLEVNKENAVKENIQVKESENLKDKDTVKEDKKADKEGDQKRQEPPIPQEPEVKVEKSEPNADLDPQALQKEDKELQKDIQKDMPIVKEPADIKDGLDKQEQLLRKLEAHQKEQKLLIEEQKKVLAELKLHKEAHNEIKRTENSPPENAKEVGNLKIPANLEKSKNTLNIPNNSFKNSKPFAIIPNETNKQNKSIDSLKPDRNIKERENFGDHVNLLLKETDKEAARISVENLTERKKSLEHGINKQENFKLQKNIPDVMITAEDKHIMVPQKQPTKARINDTQRSNKNARDILKVTADNDDPIITNNQNSKSQQLVEEKALDKPGDLNKAEFVTMKANERLAEVEIPKIVKREVSVMNIGIKTSDEIAEARPNNVSVSALKLVGSSSASNKLYDKEKREMRKLLYWNSTKTLPQSFNPNNT